MRSWNWDRLAPASGVLFIALVLVSAFLPGEPPKVTDRSSEIVAYFTHHHRSGMVAGILGGLALIAVLWLLGSLATKLREGGEARLAQTAFGGGVAAIAIAGAMTFITTALFFKVARESPDLAKPLYVMTMVGNTVLWFPVTGLIWATSVASWRSRILPQWYAGLGAIAGLITLFGGGALASKGFYSPTGAYSWIAFIAFLAWILLTSAVLMQTERAPRPAAVPA